MSRHDAIRQQQAMELWKRRTGNQTYKGIHKDGVTRKAMEEMRRKPYGGTYGHMDGSHP